MSESIDYRELVEKSQHGDDESLNRLSEYARDQLYTYVYRLTMREELTQDVVQESMLEMFRFLDKLENTDRFWPWLRRIALNKVRHHYTREKARRMISMSDAGVDAVGDEGDEGFSNLVTQELREIVTKTMSQLRDRYREVLVMRCYEEMEYSQIAEEMDCTEFSARVLFYRAKKSLAKQLSRRGLGKGALLTALVLFGKITAPSEAAACQISVTAAATKVGVTAALAGIASSKAVIVSLAAASVVAVGSLVVDPGRAPAPGAGGPAGLVKNVEQRWHFYPEGRDGAVMMRKMMPGRKQAYCLWLENNLGNFYYDRGKNTVYERDYRMWSKDLAVRRLPTDDAGMREFISQVEDRSVRMEGVGDEDVGLLVITSPEERTRVLLHPNLTEEEYFRFSWDRYVNRVDQRSDEHKRGWSYFVISGEMGGEEVKGVGRVPFVYGSARENPAWFRMQVGDRVVVCDGPDAMYVGERGGAIWKKCPEGSFFAGFGRPWMGLHTIDSVRRDAAAKRIEFESRYVWGSGQSKAEVKMVTAEGELVYLIDMHKDAVDSVKVNLGGVEGVLKFEYVSDIEGLKEDIAVGRMERFVNAGELDGIYWLFDLARESVLR